MAGGSVAPHRCEPKREFAAHMHVGAWNIVVPIDGKFTFRHAQPSSTCYLVKVGTVFAFSS